MSDSTRIARQQTQYVEDERRDALRALLMTPLMTSDHAEFAAVRRHADDLRSWCARETGWHLHVERDCARLYKRPADLDDDSRGLPGYDRRRYVLLCLACAILERADPQITLRLLGERLLTFAAEPALASRGFSFTLATIHERRELVAVCRSLLQLGVLRKVAGDEESFVRDSTQTQGADALYDVRRRVLAAMLAAVRGPSTWPTEQAPVTLDERITSLVWEQTPDNEEGRRTSLRHHLARRLLDDPVVYFDTLDAEQHAYFVNQRGAMANRLCEATGLTAEQRAEGLALTDEDGKLTDVAMPAEGTEAHATLLVAEFLAARANPEAAVTETEAVPPETPTHVDDVAEFLADARQRYGRYWRKSAREPGSEHELTGTALHRLLQLKLITRKGDYIHPLPALARFALGSATVRSPAAPPDTIQPLLFELT